MDSKKQAFLKFRSNKISNANALVDLQKDVQNKDLKEVRKAVQLLVKSFTLLLQDGMLLAGNKMPEDLQLARDKVFLWMYGCYRKFNNSLMELLQHDVPKVQKFALSAIMYLINKEAAHPIKEVNYPKVGFPMNDLQALMDVIISRTARHKFLITCLAAKLDSLHLKFGALQILHDMVKKPDALDNKIFIMNFMNLLERITLSSPEEMDVESEDCNDDSDSVEEETDEEDESDSEADITDSSDISLIYKKSCILLSDNWNVLLSVQLPQDVVKKTLILLAREVFPHIPEPYIFAGFFIESFNFGGEISVLALEGIIYLITQHNINYEGFYGKLYEILEAGARSEHKYEFFHLCHQCLLSPMISEPIVCAFMKRASRLAFNDFPPGESSILLMRLCSNLMLKYEFINKMQMDPSAPVLEDPYDHNAPLDKCNASASFLWELRSLTESSDPIMAAEAQFILKTPKQNWSLGKNLDFKSRQKKMTKITDDTPIVFPQEIYATGSSS